ncbi:MAG: 4-hydroxy-3-methylbut-2-enyl diphosphate reductase [Ignavibacteria bacterium GWA2_55_11]|nr:MAG: 4-hydroxy-3-methylbut-2-enyl diphosphate reductase [Ignavibacteria bacterium GWA2_55_11]OGU68305.1 MAG: 4-hydroxy-3-methylbut-2-enyl diphosphate reductase [Ignavibacteria bacterium RIFCSPHIGHO2_02_FULL_56_12]OGU72205.1 MAG: 4-hydroxy-3-methylbut-2-enyl diphosphate reductase [Ignavibacteria bacterium RIFCSPLOWO2_02_FULL_55_14]
MKVTVDRFSGFCWGVVRTIEIAEQELSRQEPLYSLGEIIHNPMEIQRLGDKGLSTITVNEMEKAKGGRILIRAHGEPPSTYSRAEELGITIIDATCPVVTKVQERIRKFFLEGFQIVVFGKKEHAEVIGLVGQTQGQAVVIKSLEETDRVQLNRKTVLFSQTTMDKATFYAIRDALKAKIKDLVVGSIEDEAIDFHAKDTICGQVSGRDKKIREFARSNDVVVFVAGRHSSNGKVLFDIVRSENARTHFIEDIAELEPAWFAGAGTVGITGATSTPQWLMERVRQEIERRYVPATESVQSS